MLTSGKTASGSSLLILYVLLAFVPLVLGAWAYGSAEANPPLLGHRFQDWASFVGLWSAYITLVGLGVALHQLQRVRGQAQAAVEAARSANQEAVVRISLGEYGRAAPLCSQASEAVARGELREAEVRLRLVRMAVSSAKKMADVLESAQIARDMQDIVARVSLIEQAVAAAGARGDTLDEPETVMDDLKAIELQLDDMYAEQRFSFGSGST